MARARGWGRAGAKDAARVGLVKAASAAVVLAWGFSAVSDDDYARVVIAEEWARAPRLDPSGTSWLPLPFWITGLAMRAFGRSLEVARGVSIGLGILSALLVFVAARWITEDRRAALAGAIAAAIFPWSARLGVATVPELPAAALALLGVAALVPPARAGWPSLSIDANNNAHNNANNNANNNRGEARSLPPPGRMLIGGAALAASTLSRYDAWPIAAAFAIAALWIAARGFFGFFVLGANTPDRGRAALARILAAALALAGPVAWILWNRHAHGSALHFLERVAAYRRALGGSGGGGALHALFAYPEAFVRHEPELVGVLVLIVFLCAASTRLRPPFLAARLRRYALPAAILLGQIALLSAAMVRDGAPTHHPERALLSAMLLLAVAAGDFGSHVALLAPRRARPLLALAVATWLLPAALHYYPWLRLEDFANRKDEVAIGRAARAIVPPGERVLLEVTDYSYFAVMAAFGRPEDIELDRSVDPRGGPSTSSFDDIGRLRARADQSGAQHLIALEAPGSAARAIAREEAVRGAWALFRRGDAGSVER
jgi:hypothetical protein